MSNRYKLVTFSLSATDESDDGGFDDAIVYLRFEKPNGDDAYRSAYWSAGEPVLKSTVVDGFRVEHQSNQVVFSDEDFGGIWSIDHVYLSDTPGNTKTYRRDELDALGTKNIVNVIDGSVAVGDLLLDANSPQAYAYSPSPPAAREKGTTFSGESIEIANTNFEGNDIWVTADGHYFSRYPFSIWNNSSSATEEVTLRIAVDGAYRAGFNQNKGASICETSLSTEQLRTSQTCVLSSFSRRERRNYVLWLGTSKPQSRAKLNFEVYTSSADLAGADNHHFSNFKIRYDNDDDGVADDEDAFQTTLRRRLILTMTALGIRLIQMTITMA